MRIRRTHITLMLISVVLFLIPLVLHVPNPYGNPVVQEVHETSHTILFFFAQLALMVVVRRRRPEWSVPLIVLGTSLLAIAIGGIIEVVQPYIHRSRSWEDIGRDALGIVAACGVFYCFHTARPSHKGLALGVAALALVIAFTPLGRVWHRQWAQAEIFPVLADFDEVLLQANVGRTEYARIQFVPAPEAWQGNSSRVLEVFMPKGTRWSGFALYHPVPRWPSYNELSFEVFSVADKTTRIALNIYSVESGSKVLRYHAFDVAPGLNILSVDLNKGPAVSGQYINKLLWYSIAPERDETLYFDNIRLH